jgi:hypothetical protein
MLQARCSLNVLCILKLRSNFCMLWCLVLSRAFAAKHRWAGGASLGRNAAASGWEQHTGARLPGGGGACLWLGFNLTNHSLGHTWLPVWPITGFLLSNGEVCGVGVASGSQSGVLPPWVSPAHLQRRVGGDAGTEGGSDSSASLFISVLSWWHWGLNSGPCGCKNEWIHWCDIALKS